MEKLKRSYTHTRESYFRCLNACREIKKIKEQKNVLCIFRDGPFPASFVKDFSGLDTASIIRTVSLYSLENDFNYQVIAK